MRPAVLAAAVGAAALTAGAAQAADADSRACRLAADLVQERLDGYRNQPLVFSEEVKPHFSAKALVRTPPLRPELVAAYSAAPRPNAVTHCREVRRLLERHHIPYGAEAVAKVRSKPGSPPAHTANIAWIFLPVVSRDGREALVETGLTCNGLCGSGDLSHLTLGRDGRWKHATVLGMWMS